MLPLPLPRRLIPCLLTAALTLLVPAIPAAAQQFYLGHPIPIPSVGAATPYPSTITVSGVTTPPPPLPSRSGPFITPGRTTSRSSWSLRPAGPSCS